MCGLNDVRSRYVKTEGDIRDIFESFKSKIEHIKVANRSASIFYCPIIPTRSPVINRKTLYFNELVFSYIRNDSDSRVSTIHGFDMLLDHEMRLHKRYAVDNDEIHLNSYGAGFVAGCIKRCIRERRRTAHSGKIVSNMPYSSAVARSIH